MIEESHDGNINNGNRSHENGVEVASYDAQDRLTRYKDNAYTYNLLGQLTNKTSPRGTANYNYDVQGNLLGVETELGNRIEYLIDPLNRRVGRKVNGTITNKYLYLGQLHPIAELYPDTDQLKYLFIYAEKAHVPSAIEHYNESNQLIATYRVLTNHLGSVVKVVNAEDQSIVQAIEYDAWGNVLSDTNPLFQPFYYAGGLYDPETKLTRFGARDYDAEIGRWTAKDPLLFVDTANVYEYVMSDPINGIDPTGLWCFDFDGFATQIGRNNFGTALYLGGLINAGLTGAYPKTMRDIRGGVGGVKNLEKEKFSPYTNQISRHEKRINRFFKIRPRFKVFSKFARTDRGMKFTAFSTAILVFEGFYSWGNIAKSAWDNFSTNECGCK